MTKELTFNANNAHARSKFYTRLHLLTMLCGGVTMTAEMLGCTRATYNRAINREPTELTLDQIKRAARSYALEVFKDVGKYEWGAIQELVRIIDPQADISFNSFRRDGTIGPRMSIVILKHLDDHWDKPLSHAIWHFKNRNYKAKYIRQMIRRLIKRNPVVALRAVDDDDTTPDDVINRFQKIVTPDQLTKAIARAKTDDSLDGTIKRPPVKKGSGNHTLEQEIREVKKAVARVTPQGKPKTAKKPIRPDKPDPKQEPVEHKTKPPIKVKKDPATPDTAPTVIDDIIAKRQAGEGPSAAVAARLAKLMVQ